MRFLILAACLALASADGGGDHHHHHEPEVRAPATGYAEPAAPSYGAPAAPAYNAPAADSYGAPQEAPVYAPPAPEYGAPQQEYVPQEYAPQDTYGAPQDAYGAPAAPEYAAPVAEYDAPAPAVNYAAVTDTLADVMDMSKLLTVLPLLVAVGAAIIVAQVFAPLLGGVFGLKATAVAGFLAPLGTLKVGILNTLLAPTGLTLCNIGPPLAQASGREAASGFDFDQDKIDMVANMMYNAIKSKPLAIMTPFPPLKPHPRLHFIPIIQIFL